MSRIGKQPILIPDGVNVTINDLSVLVKGPKGSLDINIHKDMNLDLKDNVLVVSRSSDNRDHRSLHGTTRMILMNCVTGVSEGFYKELEIQGVGWNCKMAGSDLELSVGFCHTVKVTPPEGVNVELKSPTEIIITGIDKQAVGQYASNVRRVRPPEPYKGKGIRYIDEHVRRKSGKSLA